MRISIQLSVAFTATAAIAGGIGYHISSATSEIQRQVERLSRGAIPTIANMAGMSEAVNRQTLAAAELVRASVPPQGGGTLTLNAPETQRAREEFRQQDILFREALHRQRMNTEALIRWAEAAGHSEWADREKTATVPFLAELETQFSNQRQMMDELLGIAVRDADAAADYLENKILPHSQQQLLSMLAERRRLAEREFTGGVRGVERALEVVNARQAMLTVAAMAAAVGLGLLLSRFIGKPLHMLKEAALAAGRGDLNAAVAIRRNDEIGVLAQAFNQMLADLRETTVSISMQKRTERQLRASLEEKELLLKEVHHRVKNNLQIVSSLLSLQVHHGQSPETLRLLIESQRRIRAMALIHEQLYRSDDLSQIDFAVYVQELADQLCRSHDGSVRLAVRVEAQHDRLPLDQAVPCGMIVSELVSNAAKHAFPGREEGEIVIGFSRYEQGYQLSVRDNGIGVPLEAAAQAESLGLRVVRALVRQIHGQLHMECCDGTLFEITFPASVKDRQSGPLPEIQHDLPGGTSHA
ncbi:MAG: histidine kinase dimerization/phosphoacceptor domain -containing protein [Thermoguttaceae bacterium]|jgi:two-component sensor histidine kinase/HAMP domain-containing protein|nr:histidine kinase dimerization/phosphoacceptor domain -containing protein [Thermoguttaceae bacterium]